MCRTTPDAGCPTPAAWNLRRRRPPATRSAGTYPTWRHTPSARSGGPGLRVRSPSTPTAGHGVAGEEVPVDPLAGHLPSDVLEPFRRCPRSRPLVLSGHAQPGQSKPPFSWFIRWIARVPAANSRLCASTFATLRPAPQPARDGDNPSGELAIVVRTPPVAGRPGSPCPSRSPAIGVLSSVTGVPFVRVVVALEGPTISATWVCSRTCRGRGRFYRIRRDRGPRSHP